MINDGTAKWEINKVADEAQVKDIEKKVNENTILTNKLISVPSWWLNRGDGSDGDFYPTADTVIDGVKQFKSVYIPEGITITVTQSTCPFIRMLCQGVFINHGIISTVGKASTASGAAAYFGGGGGWGYSGGNGSSHPFGLNDNLKEYMFREGIIGIGAIGARNDYGEAYGVGGGCIQVVCKEFDNIGTLTSSGSNGGSSHGHRGGGGGGGSVMVVCETLVNAGTLLANGGGRYDSQGGLGEAGTVRVKELKVLTED